jgi:outer membrane protein TolC
MFSRHSPRRRFVRALLRGLVAPACLWLGQWAAAADPPTAPEKIAAPQPAEVAPAKAQVLDLAACRHLALERQPAIAAAAASVANAQARAAALDKLHAIPVVAGDLPIRRQQAALGVTSAEAQLEQARWDTLYDVTRSYYTVVYARMQVQVANDVLRDLAKARDLAKDAGSDRMARQASVYITAVEGRRETARAGVDRALAALRESIGLPADACIDVADTALPDVVGKVCREDVIALAVSRRGEVIQAASAAEVTGFEVQAQESKRFAPTNRTFAAATDIHTQPIPPAGRGADYAPAAVGPEMPTLLVGKRADRVEQARALSARADSVVEKTRGLVALEADDGYNRWLEHSRRLPKARAAAKDAQQLADELAQDAKNRMLDVRYSEVTTAKTVAGQLRLEANEVHLQLLLSLAALERITGGGFCPGFDTQSATRP